MDAQQIDHRSRISPIEIEISGYEGPEHYTWWVEHRGDLTPRATYRATDLPGRRLPVYLDRELLARYGNQGNIVSSEFYAGRRAWNLEHGTR